MLNIYEDDSFQLLDSDYLMGGTKWIKELRFRYLYNFILKDKEIRWKFDKKRLKSLKSGNSDILLLYMGVYSLICY